jgi:putative ABC transport system permease protein
MSFITQTSAITAMNLRSLPKRIGTSTVIVVGIAAVVAVLVSVLAMATGFTTAAAKSARSDRVIVLSNGAEVEAGSGLPRVAATTILDAPAVRKNVDGKPIASAEVLAFFR